MEGDDMEDTDNPPKRMRSDLNSQDGAFNSFQHLVQDLHSSYVVADEPLDPEDTTDLMHNLKCDIVMENTVPQHLHDDLSDYTESPDPFYGVIEQTPQCLSSLVSSWTSVSHQEPVPLNLHGVTPQAKVLSSTSSSAEPIHSVTQLRSEAEPDGMSLHEVPVVAGMQAASLHADLDVRQEEKDQFNPVILNCAAVMEELLNKEETSILMAEANEDVSSWQPEAAAHFQPDDGEDFAPPGPFELPHQQVNTGDDDKLIYEGARITIRDSMLLMLTFVQTEHLGVTALGRLLSIIELHCPKDNRCKTSTYNLFQHLENLDSEFEIIYYCSVCWRERPTVSDLCTQCPPNPKKEVHFYVDFLLDPQIEKLYKRPDFLSAIQYKKTRVKKCQDNYEDLYDGEIYKEAEQTVLANEHNISCKWYGDGIQLYESSSYSLWPFYCNINELPPDERYKPENLLLCGIWGSKDHPHPNVFLKRTAKRFNKLREGIKVDMHGFEEKQTVKVILLCGVCDAPAKAAFLNLKSHAGYHSCPICFTEGEKSNRTGNVMVFPYVELLELRSTDDSYVEHVREARRTKKPCQGVKGPTLLFLCLFLCMYRSTGVDPMHGIYGGVVKHLLGLWVNTTSSKAPYYLGEHVGDINKDLLSLNLPRFVQRLPVAVDKLSYWKMSLFYNFFFYIMLIVLKKYMKPEYYDHVCLLVDGVSLLNQSSVSPDDLVLADNLLNQFVKKFQTLYGIRNMTINVHILRHLALLVRRLGPLWVMSCFPLEDLNGKIALLAHGTKYAALQIGRKFFLFQELPYIIKRMSSGPAKEYCLMLLTKWKRMHIQENVAKNILVVGFYDPKPVIDFEISELLRELLSSEHFNFVTFPKLYIQRQLVVASSYQRSTQDSSYVKYLSGNDIAFGEVLTFVKATTATNQALFLVYIRKLAVERFSPDYQLRHMHKCNVTNTTELLFVSCLKSVCFKISCGNEVFVCTTVNDYERM